MTATGLWLRLAAGTSAAVASLLLVPIDPPTPMKVPAETAALLGALGGIALFSILARARPAVRLAPWTRRAATRSSFFVVWASVEEALWRRLALGGIALHAGWIAGLVCSSVGFALSHRLGKVSHLVTGFGFGTAYLATGQLLAAIAMHAVYNLLLDQALSRPLSQTA